VVSVMSAKLADYIVNGEFVDGAGCFHATAGDLLQAGLLGFCCCGMPDENLRYVLGGLELIESLRSSPQGKVEWSAWWEEHKARELRHFGSERAAYFFYYWCSDPAKLTEHGSGVPGWLTEKGKAMLDLLREWDVQTNPPKAKP